MMNRRRDIEQEQQAAGLVAPLVGLLAWILPGLGHILLGHRARGLVILVTVTATFWTGVAIGGVTDTVDPQKRSLWFLAQLCTGGNTGAALVLHQIVMPAASPADRPSDSGNWVSAEVGVHYTGVAGLLNLLVILDALARSEAPLRRRRPADDDAKRGFP